MFDFHETLVRLKPEVTSSMAEVLGVTAEVFGEAFSWTAGVVDDMRRDGSWYAVEPDATPLFYRLLAERTGCKRDLREVASSFAAVLSDPRRYEAFPDALTATRELQRRGIEMAVLSNSEYPLGPILEALGFGDAFSTVVSAMKHFVAKPDARAFQLVLERMGLPAEACWFVGDRLDDDFFPARRVGMAPVLVDRGSTVGADFEGLVIADLRELVPLVAERHASRR